MPYWWNKKYGKNSICGITQSRLRPGKNYYGSSYVLKLPCKHTFYRSALQKWILTHPTVLPTCPLCRKIFDPLLTFN